MDTDQQVRQRFLEESGEYFEQMEQVLLDLPTADSPAEQLDIAMRAAHSLKGGAGMMGFTPMAQIAHSLEDFLKILRARKLSTDTELETLLLQGVDCLKLVQQRLSNGLTVDEDWMTSQVEPVVTQLRARLGELSPEDEDRLLSEEEDVDMAVLVFIGAVEESLNTFETTVKPCQGEALRQALCDQSDRLSDLGLMGELEAFVSLCQSICNHARDVEPEQLPALRDQALTAWRRSQSLVQLGRMERLPMQLDFVSPMALPQADITDLENSSLAGLDQLQAAFDQIETPSLHGLNPDNLAAVDPLQAAFDQIEVPSLNGIEPADTASLEQLQAAFDQIEAPPSLDRIEPVNAANLEQLQAAFDQIETPSFHSDPGQSGDEKTTNRSPAQNQADGQAAKTTAAPKRTQPVRSVRRGSTLRVAADDLQQINDLFGTLILERNAINLRQQQLVDFVSLLQNRMEVLDSFNDRLRQWYGRASMESLLPMDLKQKALVSNGAATENNLAEDTLTRQFTNQRTNKAQRFDALEMDQYSELHLMAQEQMETIVKLQEVTADISLGLQEMGQSTQSLNGTTRQLRKRITRTQMRPFSDIVGHFPRVIRDLSVKHGKKVKLKLIGETTLFERVTLDLVADPLNHILRNSFDHGIETEAERLTAGKLPEGTISIQASQMGSQARIVIQDDGHGINMAKICDRIRQHGISEEQIARMSQQQLLSTIFDAGFSTAEQVTELSGRGVGMNVVRTNIDKLGGTIRVDTQPGQGTTFTIDLPLSLSVLRIMLFEQQDMVFAIPVDVVEELITLSTDNIIESDHGLQLRWKNRLLPLTLLEQYLTINSNVGFTRLEGEPVINRPMVLVISDNEQYYAVSIQRFWGEQEVATRPIVSPFPLPSGFVGATVLGDGRVVPMIDLPQLITNTTPSFDSSIARTPADGLPNASHPLTSQKTILVVDDSVHSRRFLTITLEKAGYLVEQARDGQEAVDKLLGGLKVQAMLCDVEMPRLDGYGVLDQIKSRPEYDSLPISMLTSRSSDKHRKLAMNLGASAYFAKPYNEQELLQTLATLTKGQ